MAASSSEIAQAADLPRVDTALELAEVALRRAARRRLVSIVVPLLNEEATVNALYHEVQAALAPLEITWELVYVDDGSTDGSYRELVRLHAAHENVRVVRLRRNFGKAAALAAGFDAAAGAAALSFEDDTPEVQARIPAVVPQLDEDNKGDNNLA